MQKIANETNSEVSSQSSSDEGPRACSCIKDPCKCVLNEINVLTSEHDLLFQTINHVSNKELKRNILETLRDSLTNESSSKPFPKRKTIPEKCLSEILKALKE